MLQIHSYTDVKYVTNRYIAMHKQCYEYTAIQMLNMLRIGRPK